MATDAPYEHFRWATAEEALALATADATIRRQYTNVDGWLDAYLLRAAGHILAAFQDTTTGKWVLPTGASWPDIDPLLLAADAANWIDQQ